MKIYIAHNITASQGGSVLGVYPNYQLAKEALIQATRFGEGCTDWGHFIRVGELGKPFYDVLNLPWADVSEEK